MKNRFSRFFPLLLALLLLSGCGQKTQGGPAGPPAQGQGPPAPSVALPKEAWPADLAPTELPEYTAGTVTASAVDGEGVLTIKVQDTGQFDMEDYLERLQSAGWIVTSNNYEAEAVLGLYTVTLALQAGDTMLQIDVYTAQAGSWPADEIPPDVPEPETGTLVGTVDILETSETMWYFNYTYDGVDQAAAEAYMNGLAEKGWSGDTYQMFKSFDWNGRSYEASIEIYETVETRTTFTCNFYLSAA